MIADAHVDILLELAHREHRLGETDVFARTWLPLLEAGGVGLQVCPVFVDLEYQPEGLAARGAAPGDGAAARAARRAPTASSPCGRAPTSTRSSAASGSA